MDKKLEVLHDLCDVVSRELEDCNEKIRQAGGKLSAGDVDYLDKLTHAMKSIKTTIAMIEADDEESGYSRGYMPRMGTYYDDRTGRSYAGGMRSDGRSYARGARRDGMGRYSREGGYSYAEDMEDTKEEIRELAQKMPEEHRRKLERALDELR